MKALKDVFRRAGARRPNREQTDRGLEFYNRQVKELFRQEGILKHYSTHDQDTKAILAEHFIAPLKSSVTLYDVL